MSMQQLHARDTGRVMDSMDGREFRPHQVGNACESGTSVGHTDAKIENFSTQPKLSWLLATTEKTNCLWAASSIILDT
jgi:hypothetical protein